MKDGGSDGGAVISVSTGSSDPSSPEPSSSSAGSAGSAVVPMFDLRAGVGTIVGNVDGLGDGASVGEANGTLLDQTDGPVDGASDNSLSPDPPKAGLNSVLEDGPAEGAA